MKWMTIYFVYNINNETENNKLYSGRKTMIIVKTFHLTF